MTVTELASSLGYGVRFTKYTIPYTDLAAVAATSATLTLFTLPQGAIVLATRLKHTVAFAGPSITDMSCVVGIAGTTNLYAADLDIDAAVADTTLNQAGVPAAAGHAAVAVIMTIGSTGANLSVLTAGSVDFYIAYLSVTTPSA